MLIAHCRIYGAYTMENTYTAKSQINYGTKQPYLWPTPKANAMKERKLKQSRHGTVLRMVWHIRTLHTVTQSETTPHMTLYVKPSKINDYYYPMVYGQTKPASILYINGILENKFALNFHLNTNSMIKMYLCSMMQATGIHSKFIRNDCVCVWMRYILGYYYRMPLS